MTTLSSDTLQNNLNQYALIRCPFDLNFKIVEENKKFTVKSLVQDSDLNQLLKQSLHLSGIHQWRFPDRPVLQIKTPYRFVSDVPVYLSQVPAFAAYHRHALPGVLISGRFPINIWPRVLMWAVEIHAIDQPIVFKHGDPWFMVRFESSQLNARFKLFEAEETRALSHYIQQV